jgi:hypothetical protein
MVQDKSCTLRGARRGAGASLLSERSGEWLSYKPAISSVPPKESAAGQELSQVRQEPTEPAFLSSPSRPVSMTQKQGEGR